MFIVDKELPNVCSDCACFVKIKGDGEYTHDSDGCTLLKREFNEYVYYGKHEINPDKEKPIDCPLINLTEWSKNEYKRGWHDALSKALDEAYTIHFEGDIFQVVQVETLIGLGYAMAEPQEGERKHE